MTFKPTYDAKLFDSIDWAPPSIDLEELSARLHDIYQMEAHRRGDVRHADRYEDLSEATKEWDRVLARWILKYWSLRWPDGGLPPP